MDCRECKWFWLDDRNTDYRQDTFCFCRRKGAFFSRNFRIGEGTRIAPNQKACSWFEPAGGSCDSRD